MASRTYATEEVLSLFEKQEDFELEKPHGDFNNESDNDGVQAIEADFTSIDGTQSLVDPGLLSATRWRLVSQTLQSLDPAERDLILLFDKDLVDDESSGSGLR